MNQNSSGSVYLDKGYGGNSAIRDPSGNISGIGWGSYGPDDDNSGEGRYKGISLDVSHTHSITFTPSITDNIGVSDNISFSINGSNETRCYNFTERYWKRIA